MTSPTELASTGPAVISQRAQVTGLGLVGTSIALALRAQGWWVTGNDLDDVRARRAHELGAVDEIGVDHLATVAFVATPVAAIVAEVNALLVSDRSGELVVTDVGGVKGPIVAEISTRALSAGTRWPGPSRKAPTVPIGSFSRAPPGSSRPRRPPTRKPFPPSNRS